MVSRQVPPERAWSPTYHLDVCGSFYTSNQGAEHSSVQTSTVPEVLSAATFFLFPLGVGIFSLKAGPVWLEAE